MDPITFRKLEHGEQLCLGHATALVVHKVGDDVPLRAPANILIKNHFIVLYKMLNEAFLVRYIQKWAIKKLKNTNLAQISLLSITMVWQVVRF